MNKFCCQDKQEFIEHFRLKVIYIISYKNKSEVVEEKIKNNTKPTKAQGYISPEEKMMCDEIEKELFYEVNPGLFIEKEKPSIIDPNEACYKAISTYVYGFQEYAEKIEAVTDINYVR